MYDLSPFKLIIMAFPIKNRLFSIIISNLGTNDQLLITTFYAFPKHSADNNGNQLIVSRPLSFLLLHQAVGNWKQFSRWFGS